MACWAVLVGGETASAMKQDRQKTRSGKYLGSHCSLNNIGKAYAQISKYVPPTNIIVIAQLREVLEWLEDAASSPERTEILAGRAGLHSLMNERLKETKEACAELIARGGADYDFLDVNPATVFRVLAGDTSLGPRVLPPDCSSVLLVLNSHGNAHDVESVPQQREWYVHLPYPVPPTHEHVYQYTSFSDYYTDHNTGPHAHEEPLYDHRCILYSQHFFQAMHTLLTRPRPPSVVFINQSCLSEGLSRCLYTPAYRVTHGTDAWRMLSISTARELQPSLGTFLGIWLHHLDAAVRAGGTATLMHVYHQAAAQYHAENPGIPPYDPATAVPASGAGAGEGAGPSAGAAGGSSVSAPAPAPAAAAEVGEHAFDESTLFGQLVLHIGDATVGDITVAEFFALTA